MIKKMAAGFSALAIASMFAACGDDSSSTGTSYSIENKVNSDGSGTSVVTTPISVDSDKQIITLSMNEEDEYCFLDENKKLDWKSLEKRYTSQMKYLFVGDTLVLINILEGDECDDIDYIDKDGTCYMGNAVMYIGGTSGELEGKWEEADCVYSMSKKKSNCQAEDDDDLGIELKTVFDISGNVIVSTTEYPAGWFNDDTEGNITGSPFESIFIESLYSCLTSSYCSITPHSIFFAGDDLSDIIETNEISIGETSRDKQEFSIDGIDFTVNVNKSLLIDGEESIDVDVTSGEKTCSLNVEYHNLVTEDFCKDENVEKMEFFSGEFCLGEDCDVYKVASGYQDSNSDDFEDCLLEMSIANKNSTDNTLKKQGKSSDELAQKIKAAKKNIFMMLWMASK